MAVSNNRSVPEGPSRQNIWKMFDRIAGRYDLLNRLLSLRQDVRWRKKLSRHLPAGENLQVLDIATGTADVLLSLFQNSEKLDKGIGVDMAREMLRVGRTKIDERQKYNQMVLLPADAMYLPFRNDSFNLVTIAFGIRNVLDLRQGLLEMKRVIQPGGRVLILEFSLPANRIFRNLYLFYFRKILPRVGGIVSGDRYAYSYLNQTVETFPYGNQFCQIMQECGFGGVKSVPLTLGIASIYIGEKI